MNEDDIEFNNLKSSKYTNELLKASNEINSDIHSRLGWIAFWLFLIVCGVGQSVVLF